MSICIGYIHRIDLPNHGKMYLYFGAIKLPKYKYTLPIYSLLYIIFFVFIGKKIPDTGCLNIGYWAIFTGTNPVRG